MTRARRESFTGAVSVAGLLGRWRRAPHSDGALHPIASFDDVMDLFGEQLTLAELQRLFGISRARLIHKLAAWASKGERQQDEAA